MLAQEYFEQIRETVNEIERSKEMLAAMMAKEGVGAISYEPHTSGGVGDAIDTINRRMEFQERLSCRIAEASGMLDEATLLLYGEDDHGGLAKLKGNRYADVLCMAYLQAMPWKEVAEVMRCSPKWCRELSAAAFAFIDAMGFAKVRAA